MSQQTATCTNCDEETKRSTAIFGEAKEFPELIENNKAEAGDDIILCYECHQELK